MNHLVRLDLFTDFRAYLEFFLLQDLVSHDFFTLKNAAPFDGFNSLFR